MSQNILCVNSTLAGQAAFITRGEVAPLHRWGFVPRADDKVLCVGLHRYEVVLRSRLRGLDIPLLSRVVGQLLRGCRRVYLVTPPDMLVAVPWLKALFPRFKVVTWAWVTRDIETHWSSLRHCDHIFCLTEGALIELERRGFAQASLQYWGTDPSYYAADVCGEPRFDAALLGRTGRDIDLAVAAVAEAGFTVVTTEEVMRAFAQRTGSVPAGAHFSVERPASHGDVIELFRRSGVSWIPLLPGDDYPTGYTNLAESLLAGTPVLISDSSVVPSRVLALPGVYRYRLGDRADFIAKTREALAARAADPAMREKIRTAAAALLDGRALRERIEQLLR